MRCVCTNFYEAGPIGNYFLLINFKFFFNITLFPIKQSYSFEQDCKLYPVLDTY